MNSSVVGYIIITLLQIVCRVCQRKKFENQSIVGEDMNKNKVPSFLWTTLCVSFYLSICLHSLHLSQPPSATDCCRNCAEIFQRVKHTLILDHGLKEGKQLTK